MGTENTDCTLAGNSCQTGFSCDQASGTCIKNQVANDCRTNSQACANKGQGWACNTNNGLCVLEVTQSEDEGVGGQPTPSPSSETVIGVVGIQTGDVCRCSDSNGTPYTCNNQSVCCSASSVADIWKQRNGCYGELQPETVECFVYDTTRQSCFRQTTTPEQCSGSNRFSGSNASADCQARRNAENLDQSSCYTYNVASNDCTITQSTEAECSGSNKYFGENAYSQCAGRMNAAQATATVTITQEQLEEEYGSFECAGGSQPGSCQDRGTSIIQICDNGVWRNAQGSECEVPLQVVDATVTLDVDSTPQPEVIAEEEAVCQPGTCSNGFICNSEGQLTDVNCNPDAQVAVITEEQRAAGAQAVCGFFSILGVDACSNLSTEPTFDPGTDYVCFAWRDCRACPKDRVGNQGCEQLSSPNACGTKCGAETEPANNKPVTLVDIISNGISIISNNVSNFFGSIFSAVEQQEQEQAELEEQQAGSEEVIQEEEEQVASGDSEDDQTSSAGIVKSKQGIFNVDYNSSDTVQINGRGTAYALLDGDGEPVLVNNQEAYLVDGVNFGVAAQNFDPVYNASGELIGVVGDFSVQDYYSTGSQADLKGGPWYDIVEFQDEPKILNGQKVKISNFDYVSNNGGNDGAYRTMVSTEVGGVWRIVAMEYRSSDGGLISRYVYGDGQLNNTLNVADEVRENQGLQL